MNLLAGRGHSFDPHLPPAAAQLKAVEHIRQAYHDVGRPPADLDPKEALSVLLGSTRVYGAQRADIVPYDKAKMAWPPRGSQPVELIDAVAPADSLMLRDWEQRLLLRGGVRSDGDAPPAPVRSYIDPILGHSPAVYGDFVRELAERGLLNYMAVDSDDDFPVLGIFCAESAVRGGTSHGATKRRRPLRHGGAIGLPRDGVL